MNIIRLQGDLEKRSGIYYEYDVDSVPLGEGGMGRVFKGFKVVERTGERTPVAIKAIYDNIPERVIERARREANIQIDNDNLIRMHGFVETESVYDGGKRVKVHYHVIMELLIGVTLEDVMNGITSDHNGMQIPFAAELLSQYTQNRDVAVVRIMKAILSGLMALHDKGFIHRDIDPSNIMVTIDGKIKLIDFGICKQIISLESQDKSLTASGAFMGKVNYAAPELVLGDVRSQNYTTDIYALGILLFQLVVGRLPFSGTDQDILAANLRSKLPLKEVKRADMRKIIRKATEKVQSKRYATVAEMRVDMERLPVNSPSSKSGFPRMAWVAVFLVLLSGGVWYLYQSGLLQKESEVVEVIEEVKIPTVDELYDNAKLMLAQKDSVQLFTEGKVLLESLAKDSLYKPAMLDYYVMLLNSKDTLEVKEGYENMLAMAGDSTNTRALFECGLTLSYANSSFQIPSVRQSILNIERDLIKANEMLYIVVQSDTTDYKSVYWALNNLIQRKIENTLPYKEDKNITLLYRMFIKRVEDIDNDTAAFYKNAMAEDEQTLKNWNLL